MSEITSEPFAAAQKRDVRWRELLQRLGEIDDLHSVGALAHWDQATYAPSGSAPARGRQQATLSKLAHERQSAPRLGELLRELDAQSELEAALLREATRDFERASLVPGELAARIAAHTARTYEAWTNARPANDWALVRPLLQETLELSRAYASCFPHEHLADPLIELSDPGFSARQIQALFADLRADLAPLVAEVTQNPPADDAVLHGDYPLEEQWKFTHEIVGALGYDWNRGRMDETHHPFMTKFSLGDVRITVRHGRDDFTQLLFGALHETGHALYEQGINPHFENTPLAEGTSSGVHESQSRLWENQVGRSQAFWDWAFPRLQSAFPTFSGDQNSFVRAINRVEKGAIRVDADELTYNLHVLIRFELELALLEGALEIKDLPYAWRELYKRDLDWTVENDANGVLQDVHWFGGLIGGAFQGYTLGNILAAQWMESARHELGTDGLENAWRRGEFAPLHEWLREHLYRWGRAKTPPQLVEETTGGPLRSEPYLGYLRAKFAPAA